jgi:hypothetical protein
MVGVLLEKKRKAKHSLKRLRHKKTPRRHDKVPLKTNKQKPPQKNKQ